MLIYMQKINLIPLFCLEILNLQNPAIWLAQSILDYLHKKLMATFFKKCKKHHFQGKQNVPLNSTLTSYFCDKYHCAKLFKKTSKTSFRLTDRWMEGQACIYRNLSSKARGLKMNKNILKLKHSSIKTFSASYLSLILHKRNKTLKIKADT